MTKVESVQAPTLTIGELARQSGMTAATLRTWESRYGFPQPDRPEAGGGHRRYRQEDVRLLAEVRRRRQTGFTLEAAIAAARTTVATPATSFFAHLRTGHPDLRPQVLNKGFLSAVTSAMEDEYCARAEHPVLFATFQRETFFRQVERRWAELARTAACAVVFADFARFRRQRERPVEVPLTTDAPVRREWALVCDAPGYAACLVGWELPGSATVRDADRLFETVWTLDPVIVRQVSHVGIGLLAPVDPILARDLGERLAAPASPASADLRQATSLVDRILAHTQQALNRLA